MSTNTFLPVVTLPHSLVRTTPEPRLVALAAPDSLTHPRVIESLALHAMRGERLGMIIGDNRFALHTLTRLVRQRGYAPATLLTRIELSRAFTCHQLHHCILSLDAASVRRWHALYVLGLLDTFYDESVPAHEAARLLREALQHLGDLSRQGLTILSTAAPPKQPGREKLLHLVAEQVNEYGEFYSATPSAPGDAGVAPRPQMSLPLEKE